MGQSLLLAAVTVTVKFMFVIVHSKQSSGKIIINIMILRYLIMLVSCLTRLVIPWINNEAYKLMVHAIAIIITVAVHHQW